jgi:cupin 2 domain-containing protein
MTAVKPTVRRIDRLQRGNLYDGEQPAQGELFKTLVKLRNVKIERILSSDRPDQALMDQPQDEWVVLLRGTASLEIGGETVQLSEGDYLALPAHTPHRVLASSAGALWLAVHVQQA